MVFRQTVIFSLCLANAKCSTVETNELKKQIKCFDTVQHYYSNPEITGASELEYTYLNSHFREAVFHISCDVGIIEVLSVDLLLPVSTEEYCLDSKITSYKGCTPEHQCKCCELPSNTCTKTIYQQYDTCNNHTTCELKVTSEFLLECSGRTFDCDDANCHSRWAEVVYRCKPNSQSDIQAAGGTGNSHRT